MLARAKVDSEFVLVVALLETLWAASLIGAAPLIIQAQVKAKAQPSAVTRSRQGQHPKATGKRVLSSQSAAATRRPSPVSFRVARDRGLLVETWIDGSGPYTFAIDTGAGTTVISDRLAGEAHVSLKSGRRASVSGLSGISRLSTREALLHSLALGEPDNLLPANRTAIVSSGLPAELDGILDPTDAYFPFGYSIDIPQRRINAFDCAIDPLSIYNPPTGGTVVRWLMDGTSRRPFVRLDDGRLALLDTGSSFGLAVSQDSDIAQTGRRREAQDIGGGTVISRRVEPSTISIGSLTLRRVPTDIIYGAERGAPTLLGRDALYPFSLAFDPIHRLIEIAPAESEQGKGLYH
jgi:hypothetical protein